MKHLVNYTSIALAMAALAFGSSAFANAKVPSDVADLVGKQETGVEKPEIAARGYGYVKSIKDTQYWWNDTQKVCVGLKVANGSYKTIFTTKDADCVAQKK
jgi:hypothetical protein